MHTAQIQYMLTVLYTSTALVMTVQVIPRDQKQQLRTGSCDEMEPNTLTPDRAELRARATRENENRYFLSSKEGKTKKSRDTHNVRRYFFLLHNDPGKEEKPKGTDV
jgi:hypothetical protein